MTYLNELELALPLVDPYNIEQYNDLPEDIMNCQSIKREWVGEGTSSPSSCLLLALRDFIVPVPLHNEILKQDK